MLAPSRRLTLAGGTAILLGLAVAGCAAVAGGGTSAATADKRPAAVAAPAKVAAGAVVPAVDPGHKGFAALRGSSPPGATAEQRSSAPAGSLAPVSSLAASGIPSTALDAYRKAAAREATRTPSCGLSWPLLAGIGRVESNHGRFAGAVLHADGVSTPLIVGIPLNGHGTALIRDTDGGRLDGDRVFDRAVGPMQFIPSTWAGWGVDADHDGVRDPNDIYDATASAADYLCAAGRDLTTASGQVQAILSYNHSDAYVAMVMGLERIYAHGVGITVPVLPTSLDPTHGRSHRPTLPPVDPGAPRGTTHPTTASKAGVPKSGGATSGGSTRPGGSTSAPTGTHHSSSGAPSTGSSSAPSTGSSSAPSTGSSSAPSTGSSSPPSTGSSSSSGSSTSPPACPDPGPTTSSTSPSGGDSTSPSSGNSACPSPSSSGASSDAASPGSDGGAASS